MSVPSHAFRPPPTFRTRLGPGAPGNKRSTMLDWPVVGTCLRCGTDQPVPLLREARVRINRLRRSCVRIRNVEASASRPLALAELVLVEKQPLEAVLRPSSGREQLQSALVLRRGRAAPLQSPLLPSWPLSFLSMQAAVSRADSAWRRMFAAVALDVPHDAEGNLEVLVDEADVRINGACRCRESSRPGCQCCLRWY